MKRIFAFFAALLGVANEATGSDSQFPPVPKWKPDFSVSVEQILERMVYYSDESKDIVIFRYGTAVILQDDLSDEKAAEYSLKVLSEIFNYHPDMNPLHMDDGNILVRYNHPAFNVVFGEFSDKHMDAIKSHHMEGLATHEVIITPLGNNVFDEFGMKALYGRTFMFMDAQNPKIVKIYRHD